MRRPWPLVAALALAGAGLNCGPKRVKKAPLDTSELTQAQRVFIKGVAADHCEAMFRCKTVAEIKKQYHDQHRATGEKQEGTLGLGGSSDDQSWNRQRIWDRASCKTYFEHQVATDVVALDNTRNPCSADPKQVTIIENELPACRTKLRAARCEAFKYELPALKNTCPQAFKPAPQGR